MSGRLVPVGAAFALTAALSVGIAGVLGAACYDIPKPDCGFVCGPDSACPDEYTCADDHRCHRNGTPSSLVCAPPDAAPDVMPDVMIDAPAAR